MDAQATNPESETSFPLPNIPVLKPFFAVAGPAGIDDLGQQ
jgi:hypothetical protein